MNANKEFPARRLNILVADDNDGLRMALTTVLQVMGYSADAVGDGRQAVEAAARKRYDVVLMNIEMPVMDGRQAAVRLHEDHAGDCPWIVAHSGGDEDRDYFAAFGMDDLVRKPVYFDDLRSMLHRLECALPA
jgi:two-component system, sensor histidine kinase